MGPEPGDVAPGFVLPSADGPEVGLDAALAHGPVLLVFFPFAFSPICGEELRWLSNHRESLDASVLAVSADSKYSLRGFRDVSGLGLTLLSDFWPHGEVSRRYGVFDEVAGRPGRGTFLIAADGVVTLAELGDPGRARDFVALLGAARHPC